MSMDARSERQHIETIGPMLRALLADGDNLKVVLFDDSETTRAVSADASGSLVVFGLSEGEDESSTLDRLRQAIGAAAGKRPDVVVVPDLGIFAGGDTYASACDARNRHLGMATDNASGATRGRVAGKVAVVTGAAQGFGLQIAQSLAAEGAHVALTDLNIEGAGKAAQAICSEHGAERAIAVSINVTEGESIASCLHQVVRTYGGFDLFVSNAGVVKAGSVKDQAAKEFRFVTDVNYMGYFLCTQQASHILARQHLARLDYRSDIIQINSKSGLVGSNRNGAYAGSKFGGIGLTQSFALELVDDGIKVNSICPGNFFDGPLWSDPEKGLFVQYLKSGKVPGAKSVEDVKRSYESKVPMGRGCTTPDVMKALFYLMEQEYETGQALPVTGGQVMLS
jgi:sorbitol-6-phosphate 2-dehydrogenase